MEDEMQSQEKLGVFVVGTLPPGRKALPSRWVFALKSDKDGYVERFKARLVAGGHRQIEGIDYTESFAPVVRIQSIRIMIAISLIFGLEIEQLDVSTAFLHGKLEETNYMKLPDGYKKLGPDGIELVCQLVKSIYGLHQAAREWYHCLKEYLEKNGYKACLSDPCVLVKFDVKRKQLIIILIYVDDLLLMCNSRQMLNELKQIFKERFEIKDMGDAQYILGIQLERFEHGLWMGQPLYAQSILEEADMWSFISSDGTEYPINTRPTPMTSGWKHDDDSVRLNEAKAGKYRSILMKLMYLSTQTRPDLTYAVNVLSSYLQQPCECDYKALERIMRYLRGTHDYGILYQNSSAPITLFTNDPNYLNEPEWNIKAFGDASYAEEKDRKSRSGFLTILCGGVVTWYSKKQSVVALSSTEAEYYSLAEVVREVSWIKELLSELNMFITQPIVINQDNQSTMAIAMNPIQHQRVKHMAVRYHFIRDKLRQKQIELVYCPTKLMVADILTKALPNDLHKRLVSLMGIRSLSDLKGTSINDATEFNHFGK
jgi:hypothetical protein